MTKNTRTALTAILAGDATIPQEIAAEAMKVLDGRTNIAFETGRVVRTDETARLLGGVTTKTLREWAKRGRLSPVYGSEGRRIGYTADSVRALIEGRAGKAVAE
ncbi:MAG: MerR family transcriptional regulator [Kiritimatiellae bacterium]|nr:MerR family transcriptional regulator [Kiritimatiellia bacterium]